MADTIPVFMGGANYSAIFPAKSFLNVECFASAEELGKEMRRIAHDKAAYFDFFKFRFDRQANRLPDSLQPENVSLCKLCEIINAKEPNKLRRTYSSMSKFWDPVKGKEMNGRKCHN